MPIDKGRKDVQTLWRTLNDIQSTLGASDQAYSEMLGITSTRFRFLKKNRKDLPITAITELSSLLPTSVENIAHGTVDFKALDAHLVKGNVLYLPERYTKGALSKRRSSINALFYLENLQGYAKVKNLLHHFHVDPATFSQVDDNISIFFLQDITTRLAQQNFGPNHFIEIGRASTTVNKGGLLGRELEICTSVGEIYERFVDDLVSVFESNFRYAIHHLTDERCITRTYLKNTTKDALDARTYGNVQLCLLRQGLVSALPGYQGLEDAKVKKTKCIYEGHGFCEMHIEFPKGKPAAKMRASHWA